jgi:hypothetical protein
MVGGWGRGRDTRYLAIDHLEDILLHALCHVVAHGPVVPGAATLGVSIDVLLKPAQAAVAAP